MLGKTHMMVGIAASLIVTRPHGLPAILTAAGVGAIGALICDIDVGTSKSHKDADIVTGLAALVLIAMCGADFFLGTGIMKGIINNSGVLRVVLGAVIFIAVCAWGKEQPHRSFMHSILALAILSIAIGLIYPSIIPYFAVGFISHIVTDMFNRKKVRILYPLKGGVALGLFHAHGAANTMFFVAGSIASAVSAVYLLFIN